MNETTSYYAPFTTEGSAGGSSESLKEALARSRSEQDELATQFVAAEQRVNRLTALYVAIYQLHSTLDPREVERIIAEIASDILGAEGFFLLTRANAAERFEVAHCQPDSGAPMELAQRLLAGEEADLERELIDGNLRIGLRTGSATLGLVPLSAGGGTVGGLVILSLLGHRPELSDGDRDLMDLLAAHGASALVASRAYSTQQRKLTTLESLIELEGRPQEHEIRNDIEGSGFSGQLSEVAAPEVMQFIALGRRSGTLRLDSNGQHTAIGFQQGKITRASRGPQAKLSELVVEQGLASGSTVSRAEEFRRAMHPATSLWQILVAINAITRVDLARVSADHVEEVVSSAALLNEGTFVFLQDELRPLGEVDSEFGDELPEVELNPEAIVLEAYRRLDEAEGSGETASGESSEPGDQDQEKLESEERALSLLPCIQVVSSDETLSTQLHQVLLTGRGRLIKVVRVPVEAAGREYQGDRPFMVLVDVRSGLGPANVRHLREQDPRYRIVALVEDWEGALESYSEGATAALPAVPETIGDYVESTLHESGAGWRSHASALSGADLTRMRRVVNDLRSGRLTGTLALNLMSFLSDTLERALLFLVQEDRLVCIGAFGFDRDGEPLAARSQEFEIDRSDAGGLERAIQARRSRPYSFEELQIPDTLVEALGRPRTGQVVLVPVIGGDDVMAVVYCDNGNSPTPIEDLEMLDLATSHVGYAFENELLRRRLIKE